MQAATLGRFGEFAEPAARLCADPPTLGCAVCLARPRRGVDVEAFTGEAVAPVLLGV